MPVKPHTSPIQSLSYSTFYCLFLVLEEHVLRDLLNLPKAQEVFKIRADTTKDRQQGILRQDLDGACTWQTDVQAKASVRQSRPQQRVRHQLSQSGAA